MISRKNIKYIINYALLIGWAVIIFILSSEGTDASTGRSDVVVETLRTVGSTLPSDVLSVIARKGAHTVAYLALGLLAYNVLRMYKWSPRKTIVFSIMIVVLYAASDELHQVFVPGRSGEMTDVLIDSTAGTVGVGIYALIDRRRKSKQ